MDDDSDDLDNIEGDGGEDVEEGNNDIVIDSHRKRLKPLNASTSLCMSFSTEEEHADDMNLVPSPIESTCSRSSSSSCATIAEMQRCCFKGSGGYRSGDERTVRAIRSAHADDGARGFSEARLDMTRPKRVPAKSQKSDSSIYIDHYPH